jgi:hypothetical protein
MILLFYSLVATQRSWKRSFLIYFLVSDHINFVQQTGWFNVKREMHTVQNMFTLHHIVFQ